MDSRKVEVKLLIVVVAKEPIPGKVKTRLSPQLSPGEAASLYRCFLEDKIGEISTLKEIDRAIAFTPENAGDTFAALSINGFEFFAQKGKNLGERLHNIFLEKLAQGYEAVSIIDSDSPDLPKTTVAESFRLLLSNQADVVFGPCYDGGYYLVGMKKPHPELFHDIPWSTENVLSVSLEIAKKMGIKTGLLARWNDVDTFDDLVKFYDKYKYRSTEKHWAGKKTLAFLSRLERINKCVLSK